VLKDQLTMEQSIVTALQKSAEGIVGCTLAAEGLNKSRKVLAGEVIFGVSVKIHAHSLYWNFRCAG